ncbi:MAG: DUF5681 domain-containing protein [Rhodospirillaceae bacterium]
MTNKNGDDDGYEVGYRKPPKEHQFKPGQSGNLKGRGRKKPQGFVEYLVDMLSENKTVKIDGEVRKEKVLKLLARSMLNKALNGDYKTLQWILDALPAESMRAEEVHRTREELIELMIAAGRKVDAEEK